VVQTQDSPRPLGPPSELRFSHRARRTRPLSLRRMCHRTSSLPRDPRSPPRRPFPLPVRVLDLAPQLPPPDRARRPQRFPRRCRRPQHLPLPRPRPSGWAPRVPAPRASTSAVHLGQAPRRFPLPARRFRPPRVRLPRAQPQTFRLLPTTRSTRSTRTARRWRPRPPRPVFPWFPRVAARSVTGRWPPPRLVRKRTSRVRGPRFPVRRPRVRPPSVKER